MAKSLTVVCSDIAAREERPGAWHRHQQPQALRSVARCPDDSRVGAAGLLRRVFLRGGRAGGHPARYHREAQCRTGAQPEDAGSRGADGGGRRGSHRFDAR